MAHFLRDQHIKNITITEDMIKQISILFTNRETTFNRLNPILAINGNTRIAFLSYIIRFDNKGYRVFSLEELLLYFQQAKEIERIIFTLETDESLKSNRQMGTVMELSFDKKNNNGCTLTVTSNDKDWVDASFSAIQDVVSRHKNKNGLVRTAWTPLVVQVIGVTFGFFISLLAAIKISPKFSIENSFLICFLFVLLVFSNTWSYLNKLFLELLDKYFPNLKFHRPDKDKIDWVMQTICAAILGAIVLGFIGMILNYFINIISSFVVKHG